MTEILYYDRYIAVCIKPSGLLSEGDGEDCLPFLLAKQLGQLTGKDISVFCVHRLDRETCGIMVYALCSESAAALSAQIQSGELKKHYTALLCGIPEQAEGSLCDLLYYDRQKSKSFVVSRKRQGVKEARLNYKVLSIKDGNALIDVELLTGRTHQIRVQFASRGLPLWGDRRYGAPAHTGKALALCATSLSFYHPKNRAPQRFNIPPLFKGAASLSSEQKHTENE